MLQFSLDNVCTIRQRIVESRQRWDVYQQILWTFSINSSNLPNFHISMWMGSKTSVWLNQIVIHDTHNAKLRIGGISVFGKWKMEPALEPVFLRPGWVRFLVGAISKPPRVRLRDVKLFVWNNFDGRSHIGIAGRRRGSECSGNICKTGEKNQCWRPRDWTAKPLSNNGGENCRRLNWRASSNSMWNGCLLRFFCFRMNRIAFWDLVIKCSRSVTKVEVETEGSSVEAKSCVLNAIISTSIKSICFFYEISSYFKNVELHVSSLFCWWVLFGKHHRRRWTARVTPCRALSLMRTLYPYFRTATKRSSAMYENPARKHHRFEFCGRRKDTSTLAIHSFILWKGAAQNPFSNLFQLTLV